MATSAAAGEPSPAPVVGIVAGAQPIYLNLVLGSLAKLHVPRAADEVRPLAGGSLQASVYSTTG